MPAPDPDAIVVADETPDAGPPNYLARRAAVVAGVVAVVALVAVGVGRIIGGGSDDDASGVDADWDDVVLVDDRTGEIVVVDAGGDEQATYDSVRSPSDVGVVARTAVVSGDEVVQVVDLADGTTDEFELTAGTLVTPTGSTATIVAPSDDGARGVLVHGPTGDVIDTEAVADVTGTVYDFARSLAATDGREVLVTDTGNFQSVLFSFDRDAPAYFPGLALAIDDEMVVTAQNVGNNATVNVFDHDGELQTSGQTPAVRAALLGDDAIVLVTVDGSVVSMSTTSGETDEGDELAVGTVDAGTVLPTGQRLVVHGPDGTQVVDRDGDVVGTFPGLAPFPDQRALRGSTCITLAGDLDDGPAVVLADASTGRTGTSLGVEPAATDQSADGCTIAVAVDGTDDVEVVTMERSERYDDGALVALAPDGAALVVDDDGELLLVTRQVADDGSGDVADDTVDEPVELGASRDRLVFFARS